MSWTRAGFPTTFSGDVNVGLVFARGFTAPPAKLDNEVDNPEFKKARALHVNQVANLEVASYKAFYERWKATLSELKGATGSGMTAFSTLETTSRLLVGLGAESVIETSIALHRTYGVPYIPGSALKGVARRFARQALGEEWAEGSNAFNLLFGRAGNDDSFRGLVTFHDALPIPNTWKLVPDTITVHHPDYYTSKKRDVPGPSDGDAPVPVALLTATGKFLLPLTGPLAWVGAAARILRLGLRESGIGAKTAIGYGRMNLTADWLPEDDLPSPSRSASQAKAPAPSAAAPLTKEVRIERFAPNRGNPQHYATASITSDGKTMKIVAAKSIDGIEEIVARKGKGPALCTVESMGRNEWRVVSLRLLEK